MLAEGAKPMQTDLYPIRQGGGELLASYRERELTLRDLLQMLRRRQRIVYGATGLVVLLAILLCIVSTRRYQATGTIQVQRESSDGLDLESLTGAGGNPVDALNADINIQTQASILQSNSLALRTIQNLKLLDTPEFQPRSNPITALLGRLSPDDSSEPATGPLEKSPRRLAAALNVFHKNLSVKSLAGTRLIEVDYLNRDPKLAADVVNEVVQELVDYTFETRYKATEAASQSLSKQLAELRTRSESLQAQVAQMQRDSGIYSIGTTDAQGREQAYSAVLDQFQRAATTLSDASQNRILKEAIYQAAASGNAEMLSSLSGNTLGASPGITNSLATIQTLRGQEATLQGQLDQMKTKFGPGYPKIAELQANVTALQHSVQQEVVRIGERAQNDYHVADQTWKDAQENYNEQKVKADALNDKAIQYIITRQEADDSRLLYEDLLKRLKEAGILQGLKSSTITVVDQALIPIKPKKPNVPLYLAGGLAFGLFLGGAGVFVVDTLDNTIRDASAIEQMGLPLVGVLPKFRKHDRAIEVWVNPKSRYSETVRSLRSVLTRVKGGTPPKVILITSAVPGEGKTTLSMNLAASFVQQGRTVLLLEADMRRPAIRSSLGLPGRGGLSRMLIGESQENAIFAHPQVPGLFVLPEGSVPAFPSELLESDRMRDLLRDLREEFDVIVIDAPPVLPVADARVLSEMADVSVQVVRFGVTTKTALLRAHDLLTAYSKRPVGIVLNGVVEGSGAYHDYYGYRDFNRSGKEGKHENA
jgi:succinoglycan biosynthesis transport protein ExoP